MDSNVPEFQEALRTLIAHDVEFLIVGGVAANLWAAPLTTFDLDILYLRQPANVGRLMAALESLEAIDQDPAGRRIGPRRELLESGGHHRFMTSAGALDVFATIGADRSYEDLQSQSEPVELASGKVQVLSLEALIETKEEANRDKDRHALPILRKILQLRDESSDSL